MSTTQIKKIDFINVSLSSLQHKVIIQTYLTVSLQKARTVVSKHFCILAKVFVCLCRFSNNISFTVKLMVINFRFECGKSQRGDGTV